MQAVILAAGLGSRLKRITEDKPKCMVEVNGVSLIKRMLQQLNTHDLKRIVIIVGYENTQLMSYIENLNIDVPIYYVHNERYSETNNIYSLYLAKEYLLQDDTILLESDLIFEDKVLERLIKSKESNVAVVAKYEHWMDGTVTLLDETQKITKFIGKDKFKYSEVDTYYKTVNLYKFDKAFMEIYCLPSLRFHCQVLGKNSYYEQVLSMLVDLKVVDFKALCLEEEVWYEIDDLQDLNIAESLFENEKEKLSKLNSRYGGYWRYPKMLDYCYLVNPLFPNQRLINEMKQSFEMLLGNYPSGAMVNNLLVSKYFGVDRKHICVGNGAAELIKAFLERIEGKVGIINPTFEEYPNRLNKEQLEFYCPQNETYSYDAGDLISYYGDKEIEVLTLINPDNPSGNYINFSGLKKLLQWTKERNITFVVDESFIDFAEERVTLIQEELLLNNPHLVVIKSISKSYGVPGLRLGVLVCSNEEVIKEVIRRTSIWNINSFAEYFLQIIEKHKKDYYLALESFKEIRRHLYSDLEAVDYIRPIPSQANYIMCEVTNYFTARELAEILLDKYQILIKDLSHKKGFEGKEYIRLAVRGEQDNDRLIKALKELESLMSQDERGK